MAKLTHCSGWGLPTAAIPDLAATPGFAMRLVPTGTGLPYIFKEHGQIYVSAQIPRTVYPKMGADVGIVGIPNLLVGNAGMSLDRAYTIPKAVSDLKQTLVNAHSRVKELTLDHAILKTAVPHHPGE